ncbi:MAG: peptidase [Candidatus Latescibacterota bacterium]|nr:MAG: peptidase [Candidatus Latescibacterota bacterium]
MVRGIMRPRILFAVTCILCAALSCTRHRAETLDDAPAEAGPVLSQLLKLPGVTVESAVPDSGFAAAYAIRVRQPLDHKNLGGGSFDQRVILSHRDLAAPMVMVTEGYALGRNFVRELAYMLDANELRIEHRYFGESKPDSMDWQYLSIEQAAADHHHVVELFASIYDGKWVSTGWSKGGQTSLIHRSMYPTDAAATVAYDAPLNLALEEPRIDAFFDRVGDVSCRERLIEFQRLALRNKDRLLPLFRWYTRGRGYAYSVGEEKAFEYIVLEYPFSFWQYTEAKCVDIPSDSASADDMLEHLRDVVSFWSYSDHALDSPAMYQFCTELGYYGYVTKNVADLLSDADYPNCAYAPRNATCVYDPEPMQRLNDWLKENGNNIIYLYGANDPWSAPAVEISETTNAVAYSLQEGNHFTFINDVPIQKRQEIVALLRSWLE